MITKETFTKCVETIKHTNDLKIKCTDDVYKLLKANADTYGEIKSGINKLESDLRWSGVYPDEYIKLLISRVDKDMAALKVQ